MSLSSRRLPCSSLFPYTTLFRSRQGARGRRRADRTAGTRAGGVDARSGHFRQPPARLAQHEAPPRRDRKSTRLNSSHQIISYAVFCLKKKKYIKNPFKSVT